MPTTAADSITRSKRARAMSLRPHARRRTSCWSRWARAPADSGAEPVSDALLLKRIDAAVLADDPDAARALIAQAPAEEPTVG
jgi:hypothetical protein